MYWILCKVLWEKTPVDLLFCNKRWGMIRQRTFTKITISLLYDDVEETIAPGYDPHLKLLVVAGQITEDEYQFYIWYLEKP